MSAESQNVLHVRPDEIVVVGSLAVVKAGVILGRPIGDFDIIATPEAYERLHAEGGWETGCHANGQPYLRRGRWDISKDWPVGGKSQPVEVLRRRAIIIDGLLYASPEQVLEWKEDAGRPKDVLDLLAIEYFLSRVGRHILVPAWMRDVDERAANMC